MALEDEVQTASTEIVSDGYEMSVGEILNLYRDQELNIDPAFQRLFRWDATRKTRFIESLLLGIPIPPIFVFQDENGIWELIDGLQRLSTLFEFVGVLHVDDKSLPPLVLEGTNFLPSLSLKTWEDVEAEGTEGIGQALQLRIKRARLRVEILKQDSDPIAKFELFQRLNTGGVSLSEQEVRNCVTVMVNKRFHDWLFELSTFAEFVNTTSQTEDAIAAQASVELVLRYLAFLHEPYTPGLDVHEYLDKVAVELATREDLNLDNERRIFQLTFTFLHNALGDSAFKRWDGERFRGKFLMSVYEVLSSGIAKNIEAFEAMGEVERDAFIQNKARDLWNNEIFQRNSGGGVRGTTRLQNLLPMAEEYLDPHQ